MNKNLLCVCSMFLVFRCVGMTDVYVPFSTGQQQAFNKSLNDYGVNSLEHATEVLEKRQKTTDLLVSLSNVVTFLRSVEADNTELLANVDGDVLDALYTRASNAVSAFIEVLQKKRNDPKFIKKNSAFAEQVNSILGVK